MNEKRHNSLLERKKKQKTKNISNITLTFEVDVATRWSHPRSLVATCQSSEEICRGWTMLWIPGKGDTGATHTEVSPFTKFTFTGCERNQKRDLQLRTINWFWVKNSKCLLNLSTWVCYKGSRSDSITPYSPRPASLPPSGSWSQWLTLISQTGTWARITPIVPHIKSITRHCWFRLSNIKFVSSSPGLDPCSPGLCQD